MIINAKDVLWNRRESTKNVTEGSRSRRSGEEIAEIPLGTIKRIIVRTSWRCRYRKG